MFKRAFCKNCEADVAVQLKRFKTNRGRSLDVIFCPLCGKVMNMDRWLRPTPMTEPETTAGKPTLLQRLFTTAVNILPGQASFKINRLMLRLLGSYVATVPYYQYETDVPDFLDSVVNQLAILSGLQQNKGESEMEFMKRAIKAMADR